jgi:hypothetical protein
MKVLIKSQNVDHGIVELNKELDVRTLQYGTQGGDSVNKELGFRSWHCGKKERRHFQSKARL